MQSARSTGRGHYDRGLSPSQRVQQQRLLIYRHTLAQLALPTATASSLNLDLVCREAGVGRNTVYGLFESASGLILACLSEAAAACGQSLQDAWEPTTPVEEVRALARNWIVQLEALPHEVAALLRCHRSALVGLAEQQLGEVLRRGVVAGTFAPDFEPVRLRLLSEAFVGALALGSTGEIEPPKAALASSLAELVLRASR